MYPSRFRYEAPRSIDEAIALLQQYGGEAKVLAGGQSLVPLLKLRFAAPELLVDINGLPGLDYHRVDADGTIRIGALCRHADLERSALLAAKHPTMAAAAPLIADPIVRNRGTLVGSLCHADPQGDWASVRRSRSAATSSRRAPAGAGPSRSPSSCIGPFQNALAARRDRGRGRRSRRRRGAVGRLPQAGAPGRRLRHGRRGRRARDCRAARSPGPGSR